jgi:hypothetical protein
MPPYGSGAHFNMSPEDIKTGRIPAMPATNTAAACQTAYQFLGGLRNAAAIVATSC